MNRIIVITYDIGTTGVKTCLFEISSKVKLLAASMEGYKLYVFPDGGAEQKPSEWWAAICSTTKKLIETSGINPKDISGISFCSQMQGLIMVDKNGDPVRDAMSYMDQRARDELRKGLTTGIKIEGMNAFKLLKSLYFTGAVAASVKDPVWKYKWIETNEPENFKKAYKWLDVKECIICKMTGEFVMTRDSAFATLLYDVRKDKNCWSEPVCKMLGVKTEHLAKIVRSTDKIGELTVKEFLFLAAAETPR